MEEEDGNSSVYSDEYNEDGNEENIKMASWDLISKYFSLDALNKFEFLFKVINLKGDGIISNTEFDDFSYGVGIDLKTTNFEAIYKACTHGENEMDLAEFLIFIYQLKVIDADGSDSIDEDELFNLMKLLKINMPRDKLRKLVKEVDIDRSGALDFSEFLVLAAKAKEGGKYASAFQEIVNAQSRALDSGSVRSQLEKMKEKQRKDKLSASLERENSAAQRNRKLKEDLARKKRNDNQLKSKKVQIRQSQLTDKEEKKVKKVARHIDAKDKRIQSRKAKMEEDKRLEREVAAKKRKQRAMQARKKAEAIQNQY